MWPLIQYFTKSIQSSLTKGQEMYESGTSYTRKQGTLSKTTVVMSKGIRSQLEEVPTHSRWDKLNINKNNYN